MGDAPAKDAVANVVILQNIKLKPLKDGMGHRPPSSGIYSKLTAKEKKIEVAAPTVNPSISDTQDNTGILLASPSSGAKEIGRKEDSFPSEKTGFKDQPKGVKRPHYSQKSKKFQMYKKHKIFTEQTGPQWHNVVNNIVTKPIIASNLSKAFEDFPIFGKPESSADIKSFQDKACQQFVGLSDEDYAKESAFCSPDFLLTGREMEMASQKPSPGLLTAAVALQEEDHGIVAVPEGARLRTLKKLQTRITCDIGQIFSRKLKYRGVRLLTLHNQEGVGESDGTPQDPQKPPDLEPGRDILYRVRVYRPFVFSRQNRTLINIRGRHSVFSCDVVLVGKQPLTALRDQIVCRNDMDLRLDMSEHPDLLPPANSKESFPSNFMFINNVFYVDNSAGCRDTSAAVRRFAERRGLGAFPVRDMTSVCLAELALRLAHPEVYVHQGNCEHIFQFSEIRLLNNADPLHLSLYPCHTAVSQNQMLYCNNCAEFAARWIVTGSQRVPFDPAFFCETCFRSYMYIDGKKVENFKAYLYKGNEINLLKPNSELELFGERKPPVVHNKVMIHI